MKMTVTVNGRKRTVDVAPLARLLDVLRDGLALKGTKEGCGDGECGACAILLDGLLVNACCVPAIQATGRAVVTIEGLAEAGEGRPEPDRLQQAFVDEGAVHCGFCTPGMIMASRALLEERPHPSESEIRVGLSGNLCRCTGYGTIVAAVAKAAGEGYPERPLPWKSGGGERPLFSPDEAERFFVPESLDEALAILHRHPDATVLAGTTDLLPDMKKGRAAPERAIDLLRVPELKGIACDGSVIRIGACTTNGEIIRSSLLRERLPVLVDTAGHSGAPAIQNRATLGGNIANASGAADHLVLLLALGASVTLASVRGERTLPLEDFVVAYRKTACEPGELIREIVIPLPPEGSLQKWIKRGSRQALTLSRVSLAFHLEREGERIKVFRLAAGSMSPVPLRLTETERSVTGRTITAETARLAAETARFEISPRKSPDYRRAITANLVRRFFEELI